MHASIWKWVYIHIRNSHMFPFNHVGVRCFYKQISIQFCTLFFTVILYNSTDVWNLLFNNNSIIGHIIWAIEGILKYVKKNSHKMTVLAQITYICNLITYIYLTYIIIIYLFTVIGYYPVTVVILHKQNMNLVTTKFKSGGLHEKHVLVTWNLGNRLSICL